MEDKGKVVATPLHRNQKMSDRFMREARQSMGGDFAKARERGRALAAQSIKENPETKKLMEDTYGIERCKLQYPEAYDLDQEPEIVLP